MMKKIITIFIGFLLIFALASCNNVDGIKINHDISVSDSIENGTVELSTNSAKEGEEISITIIPDTGYIAVPSSEVYNYINVILDNKFIMPNEDVVVSVRFVKSDYKISIDSNIIHGDISSETTESAGGETIRITVTPEDGYALKELKYNDTVVSSVSGGKYIFLMPYSDVSITALFEVPIFNSNNIMNLTYDGENKLDIYAPNESLDSNPTSMVVYLHSGSWTGGDKDEFDLYYQKISTDKNVIVVSVNYTLYSIQQGADGSNYDIMLEDITESIEFVKNRLSLFDTTITSMGIGGYSAGGHLAMLYAYKNAQISPVPIKFVASFCPPSDFSNYADLGENVTTLSNWANSDNVKDLLSGYGDISGGGLSSYLGLLSNPTYAGPARVALINFFKDLANYSGTGTEADTISFFQNELLTYSPLSYITTSSVPTLAFYAENDGLVPLIQGTNVNSSLLENDVPVSYNVIPSVNHDIMGNLENGENSEVKDLIKTELYNYIDTYLN